MNSLPQQPSPEPIGFPEGQLVCTNLKPEEIAEISEAYRNKAPLPVTSDPIANKVIARIKTTSYYQGK